MSGAGDDVKEKPWWQRNRCEWALRDNGHSPSRILMRRWADDKGRNADGQTALWSDVALIHSYNDAESIVRVLNADDVRAMQKRLDALREVARRVIREWETRGDGGCETRVQDELRMVLDGEF